MLTLFSTLFSDVVIWGVLQMNELILFFLIENPVDLFY